MADFAIQRGSITISSATTGTITAGTEYTAPASLGSSFIRIVGLLSNSAGDDASDFSGAPQRNRHTISNPSNLLTSITFERSLASTTVVEVFYEIIEYIGSASGDHEFIVRHEENISFNTTGTTLDSSTFGSVATSGDVVVFQTGSFSADNFRGGGGSGNFSGEYVSGSTLARGTRVDLSFSGEMSIAVVEFTGSAWTVQRIDHTFTASATAETETITSVGATARAFTHYQSRFSGNTIDTFGLSFEARLSSTTQLTFNAVDIDSGMAVVAWVISNSQTTTGAMDVERITGTRSQNSGSDPDVWTESHSTAASDLTTVSVFGESGGTTAGGTDTHLGMIGLEATSTTVVTLTSGRDRNALEYWFEVVTWPEVPAATGEPLTAFFSNIVRIVRSRSR